MTDLDRMLWNHAVENEDWEESRRIEESRAAKKVGQAGLAADISTQPDPYQNPAKTEL
jgi:hypothetical protein